MKRKKRGKYLTKTLKAQIQQREQEWDELILLIRNFGKMSRAHEMLGAGDPLEFDLIEAEFKLSQAKVEAHVAKLRRFYLGQD